MDRIGICPVCEGTGRIAAEEQAKKYGWYNYDKDTDTQMCYNCGAHGMFRSSADGKVELRPDGTPCVHSWESENIGRCYHRYTCKHCGSSHTIDSGD